MFKHQPDHLSIMNTGHEINLTAIFDLHVLLTLSVTSINVRSDRVNTLSRLTKSTRHVHNSVNWAFKP